MTGKYVQIAFLTVIVVGFITVGFLAMVHATDAIGYLAGVGATGFASSLAMTHYPWMWRALRKGRA